MNKQLPYLAMDGVLCDRPQDGCFIGGKRNYARDNISNITKKETTKMKTLSADQLDDETAARIKEFLSDKLSDKDHTKLCSMLDGNFEAQDTEPYLSDPDEKPIGKLASDAKADFLRMFPDSAKIRIDNSGIPHRQRAASYSADGAKSFAEMFPDAMKIGLL